MIHLHTQRFGTISRPEESVLEFPGGIYGFEMSRRWVLLRDREHGALYWLQNVDDPTLSLSVVDPREFVADYILKANRSQLDSVWSESEPLVVLAILSQQGNKLVLNLRNPILVNPHQSTGRQIVASSDWSSHHELAAGSSELRRTA